MSSSSSPWRGSRSRSWRHAQLAGLVPLRCRFCGETWSGPVSSIGNSCADNPLVGSVDVYQCSPEELVDPDDVPEVF